MPNGEDDPFPKLIKIEINPFLACLVELRILVAVFFIRVLI